MYHVHKLLHCSYVEAFSMHVHVLHDGGNRDGRTKAKGLDGTKHPRSHALSVAMKVAGHGIL